jgi:hypothetical protein
VSYQKIIAQPVMAISCPACAYTQIVRWNGTKNCDQCTFVFEVIGLPAKPYKSNPEEKL